MYSRYLIFPHIPGAGELLIFCAAMAGAGLAFLWFNTHPAQVFMGDVGRWPWRRPGHHRRDRAPGNRAAIMGGIFVVEAPSVMLQVTWFKHTKRRYGEGRRLLKMAPLHHHFEKSGWKETQVVVRFWIITMLLCLIGLSTLAAMNPNDPLHALPDDPETPMALPGVGAPAEADQAVHARAAEAFAQPEEETGSSTGRGVRVARRVRPELPQTLHAARDAAAFVAQILPT